MCARILTPALVKLRIVVIVALGGLAAMPQAHAQSLRGTVVLPVHDFQGGDVRAQRAADPVQAALLTRDQATISLHDARDRFVMRSRPPVGAAEGDVDVLAREARAALEHVAFGRTASAQRSVKEVMTLAERALESLNRETATARQVLDACLALVRSALHRDDRREALDQATSCRRLVPDVAPNQSLHPASVIGVLAEADDQLRRLRTGRLRVLSVPESSCSVFLNGRHLGTTPFVLERAAPGKYRVQVECSEERGRVHVVELGDEPTELRVDAQLDRAISSDPRLALRYASPALRDALAVDHATQVGRALRAESVVLVAAEAARVVLSRVSVEQARLVGRVYVPWSDDAGYDAAALTRALEALWEGRMENGAALTATSAKSAPSTGVSEGPAREAADSASPAPAADLVTYTAPTSSPASAASSRRVRLWTGLGLSVAAATAFATGVVFEQRAANLDDDLASRATDDPKIDGLSQDLERAQSLRWIGLGGLVATVAVPLLAKHRTQVPWWSYVITAAGAAALSAGVYELARANDCELRASEGFCIQKKNTQGRAGLWLSAGVPLLSVLPTHFWLRSGARSDASLTVSSDGTGARALLSFRVGGT